MRVSRYRESENEKKQNNFQTAGTFATIFAEAHRRNDENVAEKKTFRGRNLVAQALGSSAGARSDYSHGIIGTGAKKVEKSWQSSGEVGSGWGQSGMDRHAQDAQNPAGAEALDENE